MSRITGLRSVAAACAVLLAATAGGGLGGEICVRDDIDRQVCLEEPAQRIVSLSPGVTELLFTAGAGERIVGTTTFSDYPEAARTIPRVGTDARFDTETILASAPQLVVAWRSGNPREQVRRLEQLGLTVYWTEQRDLEEIARAVERLGRLAGTHEQAQARAGEFRAGVQRLRQRYRDASPVPVFYEIWPDPLMTVNGEHLISRVIELCGGENVFGGLARLTPRLDVETVLAADPEAIVVAGMGEDDPAWLERWRGYERLTATRRDNLFFVPPSSIQRPTLRVIEGARTLCRQLERARKRR